MREFKKWFLVILILVLAMGWEVGLATEIKIEIKPQPTVRDCAEEFLYKVLERILGVVPENYYNVEIGVWLDSYHSGAFAGRGLIIITERLMSEAENEAEIAFVIAHELGHIFTNFVLGPEEKIDHIGIQLMAQVGYDVFSAVDILERIAKEQKEYKIKLEEDEIVDEKRIEIAYRNALRYSKKDQKKWILFTPKDLEKIKEFLRNGE